MIEDTHAHRITIDEMTLEDAKEFIIELRTKRELIEQKIRKVKSSIDTMKHGTVRNANERMLNKLNKLIEKIDKYTTEADIMLRDVFGVE